METLWIELKPKNILLAVVYHPPSYGQSPEFFEKLAISVEGSLQEHKEIILTGDLNQYVH